ncbi:MAG: hypothetical protein V1788_01950, partial [Nanoarchaeota archaeon]
MKNKIYLIGLCMILGILIMQNIIAIGITPARTTINFEKGLSQNVPFSILNSENKDMSVVFTVRGDLAEYVTLTQAYAEFSSSEGSKSFNYIISLPQDSLFPGRHEAEIVALEMPKDIKEKGTFVGATLAVITQLHVYVPYPDKYVEGELNIIQSQQDSSTVFLVPVTSRGKLDVIDVRAIIDVYTSLNEKVATVETNSVSLNSLERKDLSVTWPANVNPGKYLAIATIIYDEKTTEVQKEFQVGNMIMEIKEVIVKDFELGGIAKFDALVESKWSTELKDVYLNIIVYNHEGEVMADFKSPNYNMLALGNTRMVAYWDTAGVKQGTYEGKISINYKEKPTNERNIQMKITDSSIEIIGLTGQVVIKGKGGFNFNNILIAIVV